MTDYRGWETREGSGEDTQKRSGEFGAVLDTVQALGGPAAALGGAKLVKDIVVAQIQANATVKKARIENGRPEHGGGDHRAD